MSKVANNQPLNDRQAYKQQMLEWLQKRGNKLNRVINQRRVAQMAPQLVEAAAQPVPQRPEPAAEEVK